jgi:predicted nucleotidyltransferase
MKASLSILPPDAANHLTAFKREVEQALPGRVALMALFGSHARGEADNDSDYDVAVLVRALSDRSDVRTIVSSAAYRHILEGVHISPIVLPSDYLEVPARTELAAEIARDGIAIP